MGGERRRSSRRLDITVSRVVGRAVAAVEERLSNDVHVGSGLDPVGRERRHVVDARTMTLSLHLVTGVAGRVLGPAAMRSLLRPGRDIWVLGLYHWGVATVCATAVALAVLDWSKLWWFVPIAVGSYTFAAVAYLPTALGTPVGERLSRGVRAHVTTRDG